MTTNEIVSTLSNAVRLIKLNRPDKKNAVTTYMYRKITEILNEDAKNDKVVVTILTGTGEYFSSGNDLKSAIQEYTNNSGSDTKKDFAFRYLVEAFINYPKIIIAVINGPAIGIGATLPGLCDIVYASNNAYFDTPFVNIGLCAEAGSSYTFSRILGRSKASEMLLLGQRLTVEDAYRLGFVSRIIHQDNLDGFIRDLYKFGKQLSVNSVKVNKALMMAPYKDILHECNEREYRQVAACADSQEFSEAVMKFMSRKSKL